MAEQHHHHADVDFTEIPGGAISGIGTKGLIAGVIGIAALAAGYVLVGQQRFLESWLVGFIFVVGLTLGCLGFTMVHHLTGGAWGMVSRRIWEAATRTLPLLVLFFIPIAAGLPKLYKWAKPDALNDPIIALKAPYLNETFFYIRAAIFFAIWIGLAFFLNRWSKEQDAAAPQPIGPADRKFRVLSGPGLVLWVLTITFMSVDWVMSLDPHWYSTIFGVIFIGGNGLAAIAFTILMLASLTHHRPLSHIVTSEQIHDLGKLMLAFVMLWAYFNFSQFLIIYSANLPEEIPFYLERFHGPWGWVSIALVVGHFALPFSLLLSRDLKRDRGKLVKVAIFVLAMRVVDLIWNIGPMFHHEGGSPIHWMDVAAVVGLGGIWLFVCARQLKSRALVPYKDPYYKEAMHVAH